MSTFVQIKTHQNYWWAKKMLGTIYFIVGHFARIVNIPSHEHQDRRQLDIPAAALCSPQVL